MKKENENVFETTITEIIRDGDGNIVDALDCGPWGEKDKPRLYYKLSPELVDGEHWTVVETPQDVLAAVEEWAKEEKFYPLGTEGDQFKVEVVEMRPSEVAALPEI